MEDPDETKETQGFVDLLTAPWFIVTAVIVVLAVLALTIFAVRSSGRAR